MTIRISAIVYGDLSGSIFEPQVKSIANVATGTSSGYPISNLSNIVVLAKIVK